MGFKQITVGEFVAAAAGPPRFRAKYMPTQTLNQELHTETSRLVGMFCLADNTQAFILHNRWVGRDVWSPELSADTDPIWETVVLRTDVDAFEHIPTGPDSTHRIEWADGAIQWNTGSVEPFVFGGENVTLGVGGALAYTTSSGGGPREFLVELELASPVGDWRLERSSAPSAFILARHDAN